MKSAQFTIPGESCKVINLARKHMGNNDSAILCFQDADELWGVSRYKDSIRRAVDSLAHSVGVFHEDFREAAKIANDYDIACY